jgi:hypothetical protein
MANKSFRSAHSDVYTRIDGTGWLPEPLRLRVADLSGSADAGDPRALPVFLADDDPRAVAAE